MFFRLIINRSANVFMIIGLCLYFVLLTSCGYKISTLMALPGNIKTIDVEMFENRTSENNIEVLFLNDIIYELTCAGIEIASRGAEEKRSEAVLSGVIKSMNIYGIIHDDQGLAVQRRVKITLDIKLEDINKKNTIIFLKDVSDHEAYYTSSSVSATEINRLCAIKKISKRVAQNISESLTSDF